MLTHKDWTIGDECWYLDWVDIILGKVVLIQMYTGADQKEYINYRLEKNGMCRTCILGHFFKTKEEAKQSALDYIEKQ